MQVQLKERIETTWGNQVEILVDSELDNPHVLTTRQIASLMTFTLRLFIEEIRAENEREVLGDTLERERAPRRGGQEQERYEQMERERDVTAQLREEPTQ